MKMPPLTEYPFPGDTYDTPTDTPRYLVDRIFFGARIGFLVNLYRIITTGDKLSARGLFDKYVFARHAYEVLRAVENSGGRLHIEGIDHIRNNKGPFVIVSNHMSTLETFLYPCLFNYYHDVTYVVKESLLKRKGFSEIMRAIGAIGVTRLNPRDDFQRVMSEGEKLLRAGRSIIIFPEGTRHTVFVPKDFNSMGIKLAKRAGAKILPVAIKTDFWQNGKVIRDFGPFRWNTPIHVKFGAPMEIQGNGAEEHDRIVEFVRTNYLSWGGEVREG
jgi:1-acyl-sn-glycerol-3-phosphate acyltransferase